MNTDITVSKRYLGRANEPATWFYVIEHDKFTITSKTPYERAQDAEYEALSLMGILGIKEFTLITKGA
jgi:hypothetical protein